MVIYYLIIINYQCAFFLCNNNYDKEHVRSDDLKHAQKAPSLPHSKPKWYSYPTAPVECGCRATWSELGDISEEENRTVQGDKSRSERPASIADGIPPAAENGRTRAPFWFAGKRLASNRQPIHIGRAVPADFSAFAVKYAEASFFGTFKKAGVFFEEKAR